jgi:hypothetical protein
MSELEPTPKLPDKTPIREVRFPTGIKNALFAAGLKTVGEVRETSDEALLSLPILERPRSRIFAKRLARAKSQPNLGRLVAIGWKPKGLTMEPVNPKKETKTAEELAAMIREDLSNVDGCPERGVSVTIYGIPWRAMLMFGAAAGPVRNKAELQKFFEIITERLQRRYDVA